MALGRSPAFQFYANDWLSSTSIALMTPAQEGAYIRLLAHAWNDPDCSIPDDDEQLAVLSRLGEEWLKGSSRLVRQCFTKHPNDPSRLVNARLLEERQKQTAWKRKCAAGGRKSGQARKLQSENQTKGSSHLVGSKRELKGNSSSSSSSSNNPYKSPTGDDSVSFQKWWESYPRLRRTGKPKAFKSWQAAIKSLVGEGLTRSEAIAKLQASVEEFTSSPKGKSQFVPAPTVWLGNARYDDDREAWQVGDKPATNGPQKCRVPTDDELARWTPYGEGGL
jgi:uncharacterized protein YdaU (DUF1376 family)